MSQQPLSPTEVSVLRVVAHQETARAKEQRNARKAEIAREMEATWAAERQIDQQIEPQIAKLDEQILELNAQKGALCDRVQALRVEMQQAKAPHGSRRGALRREQLEINEAESAEQAESIVKSSLATEAIR